MDIQKSLLQIQKIELDMVKEIDALCRRHGLTYFAIGGTALGAVRHQGFIPWDDDIDLAMPRKDYEEFLRIAPRELPDNYFVQHYSSEPATPFYFTKVRLDNTLFVEYYIRDLDIHHGIFIDIFPFDNVPRHRVVKKLHYRYCWLFYQLWLCKSLTTVCSSRFERKENYKSAIRKVIHALLTPIPKSLIYWFLDHGVQAFNQTDADEMSHITRRRLRVQLDDLYPVTPLPFESFQVPAPGNCKGYLRGHYGDFETMPPESERYAHLTHLADFYIPEELQ